MGYGDDYRGIKIAGISLGALVILSCIIVIPSVSKVDTTEIAIRKNSWTGVVDLDDRYEAGRHWIGWSYRLIKYPKTIQTITYNPGNEATDMQLTSRTADGLAIDLDVSFQYKLRLEDLDQIYMEYEKDYEPTIVRVSRSILRDVVANFTAIEFFTDRDVIGQEMEDALREECIEVYIDIVMLQLTRIDLPDSFEAVLEEVEVARQQYEIALHNQAAALVEAETLVLLAEIQAEQVIVEAEGRAEALLIETQAIATALNISVTAEAETLLMLQTALNMTTPELLSYLWIQAIEDHESSLLIIGENTPEIIIGDP